MEALVDPEEILARCPFDPDEMDEREALNAAESLSDDARFYGKESWATPDTAPRQVQNIIIRAAVRYMKNYEGYTTSRAGDEALGWRDQGEGAGSAQFTTAEIKMLRTISGQNRSGFSSVAVTQGTGSTRRRVYGERVGVHDPDTLVSVEPTGSKFPYFADSTEPW